MSVPTVGTPSSSAVPPATAGSPSDQTPNSPPAPSPVSACSTATPATLAVPAPAPDSAVKAERQTLDGSVKELTQVQQTPLSRNETRAIEIMQRLASGATYREIQTELRLSFSEIADVARAMRTLDTDVLPRLMAQRALTMLDHWANAAESGAKAGKHAAARDWLIHAKALEPLQAEAQAGAKVAIIIGQPGSPITHDSPQVTVIAGDSTRLDE